MKRLFVIALLLASLTTVAQTPGWHKIPSGTKGRFGFLLNGKRWGINAGTDTTLSGNLFFITADSARFLIPVIFPKYTTDGRPTASSYEGAIIFNTDSGFHQYSNGMNWMNIPGTGGGGGGTYTFRHSLTESSGTVNLVGDDASPGNSKYYGTNGSGIKGFYDLPSGGSGSPGGSGTEMQYRSDGSTFGGAAGTSWDNTNRLFTLEKALDASQSLSGGWLLKNATSATSGNQKISPPLWLEGNGFETTGSTSQSVRLGFDVLPVQGTTTYGTLRLLQSVNGGTISVPMTFATQTNILTLAGSSTAGRLNLTSDGSSYVQRTGNLFNIIGHNGISSRSNGTMTVYSGTTTVDPNGYSNAFFNVIRTTLPQIAAVYDASNYTTFGTNSSGNLTIAPSGGLSNFTGRLRVSALDTDGSAPTTSGTTKMVITDGNGELSFTDIPSGGGSSPYIYQYVSTQQITVTNTTAETTIYGTGEGSAGIDGSANITTGTQIVLKGAGEINTDASSAPTLQLNFKTPTSTVTFNITDLATGLNQSPYTYEYKLIPLGTGTSQSYIWQFDFYCENNLNPIVYKFGGRETSALTTTGTVTIDVTVEWSAADNDNTLVANYNTIEIFKK